MSETLVDTTGCSMGYMVVEYSSLYLDDYGGVFDKVSRRWLNMGRSLHDWLFINISHNLCKNDSIHRLGSREFGGGGTYPGGPLHLRTIIHLFFYNDSLGE
jgi:hypothetical protein